jgi:sulfonate transport system substrate-binding protein
VAVNSKSSYKTIEDLKGKTVGVPFATYLQLAFDQKLTSLGLTEKDFKMVNMPITTAQSAVVTGDIDAVVGTQLLGQLKTAGSVRIIYDSREGDPDWRGTNTLIAQEKFVKSYPEITRRVLHRFLLGAQWRSDEKNREAGQKLDARNGTPLAIVALNQQGLLLKELYNPRFDAAFVNHYKNAVQIAKNVGWIRKDVDIDQWFQKDLLEQELKAIGWNESDK